MIQKLTDFAKTKGIDLQITPENEPIVNDLMGYFFDSETNFDKKKGILLLGQVGCGKTTIIRLIVAMRPKRYFTLVECRHILREYMIDGMPVLEKYGRAGKVQSKSVDTFGMYNYAEFCFDDFGLEDRNSKLYGNSASVMDEIILDRYELSHEGMRTHAISNLDISALKEVYGNRTVDRFKEMFNIVTLNGGSLRGKIEKIEPVIIEPEKVAFQSKQADSGKPKEREKIDLAFWMSNMLDAVRNNDLKSHFISGCPEPVFIHLRNKMGKHIVMPIEVEAEHEWEITIHDFTAHGMDEQTGEPIGGIKRKEDEDIEAFEKRVIKSKASRFMALPDRSMFIRIALLRHTLEKMDNN